ncbi:MAG: FecR family protein [Marinifilaceae bacterium]|nr:FecR family protein [Marinifilaceae bacterium]
MEKGLLNQEMEERLLAFFNGELDEAANEEIRQWADSDPKNRAAYDAFLKDYLRLRWAQEDRHIQVTRAWQRISATTRGKRQRRIYFTVAASIAILAVAAAVFLFIPKKANQPLAQSSIQPVKPQATLVLSTGKKIDLNQAHLPILEQDGSTVNIDTLSGLRYDTAAPQTSQLIYNKIIVPRGGEYFLTLADGTQIWLDAESTLEYPVQFNTTERRVKLQGKAYFSVTRDTTKPFLVEVDKFSIRVHGTEFNVNAHDAQRIETVLVNGSIGFKATTESHEQLLQPNQLAMVNSLTGQSEIRDVNILPHVAWKNRNIVFANERLDNIMEEIARWYDIHVFFQNEELKTLRFDCNMPRYSDIRELFFFMEQTSDARFSVKDRTVIISKNK